MSNVSAVWVVAVLAGLSVAGAAAQSAPGPSQDQLDDAVRLGGLAALAPICGLRDEDWAADLRRAAMQAAAGTAAHDDPGLMAAPGSGLAASALSYAEAEALESFAEAPAPDTCAPLAHDPALDRADGLVRDFRAQAPGT